MKKILLTIILCFVFTSFTEVDTIPINENTEVQDTSFLYKEVNDSVLYLALEYYDVKHPKIVLAQAKLETGNYTSRQCKKGNNLFGLYNSKKKEYFKFKHWHHSVQAYKNMVQYKYKGGDYYAFLRNLPYAEASNYTELVKRIESKLHK